MILKKSDKNSIQLAAEKLLLGQVAVLPTDTVYGFSAIVDLKNKTSFYTQKKIQAIKGRENEKPFIQLIGQACDIKKYCDKEIPENLLKLWPGPLTLIVPVKKENPFVEELPAIAFRCPGDEWLRNVINLLGCPLYSTSVNRSGQKVISLPDEIQKEFGDEVSLIVDDGDKSQSVPSTILKLEDDGVKLVRQGALDVSSLF